MEFLLSMTIFGDGVVQETSFDAVCHINCFFDVAFGPNYRLD